MWVHTVLEVGVGGGLNSSCAEGNVKVNMKNKQVTVQILHNADTDGLMETQKMG